MPNTSEHAQTETPTATHDSLIPFQDTDLRLEFEASGISSAFRITKKGIVFNEDMTLEQWREGLRLFKWAQTKIKLDFAQYVNFGEIKFGKDTVHGCLAQLEFDLPNVTQAININTVPPEIRDSDLTAEHLVVLARANLRKPELLKWAKKAAEQNLSPTTLKASIANGEVVSSSTARHQTHGIVSVHGVRAEFDIWMRRVGGIEGILKQDAANVREIIGEIEVMAQVHAALTEALKNWHAKGKGGRRPTPPRPRKPKAKKKAKK